MKTVGSGFESFILYDFCCRGLGGIIEMMATGLDPNSQFLNVFPSVGKRCQARPMSTTAYVQPTAGNESSYRNSCGVNRGPPKRCVEGLTSQTCGCDLLFGDTVFAGAVNVG